MNWIVDLCPEFENEFSSFAKEVQTEIAVKVRLLEEFGPQLKRPHADTLIGSKYDIEGVEVKSRWRYMASGLCFRS